MVAMELNNIFFSERELDLIANNCKTQVRRAIVSNGPHIRINDIFRIRERQFVITDVRVQSLKDISISDCVKEGIIPTAGEEEGAHPYMGRERFSEIWDKSVGEKYQWQNNPWVWVIEFEAQ